MKEGQEKWDLVWKIIGQKLKMETKFNWKPNKSELNTKYPTLKQNSRLLHTNS
jgi:hypothetical protein